MVRWKNYPLLPSSPSAPAARILMLRLIFFFSAELGRNLDTFCKMLRTALSVSCCLWAISFTRSLSILTADSSAATSPAAPPATPN